MARATPLFPNNKWESELLASFHELYEANDHHGVLQCELVAHMVGRFSQSMEHKFMIKARTILEDVVKKGILREERLTSRGRPIVYHVGIPSNTSGNDMSEDAHDTHNVVQRSSPIIAADFLCRGAQPTLSHVVEHAQSTDVLIDHPPCVKNESKDFFELADENDEKNAWSLQNALGRYFHDVSDYPVQKRAKEIQWFTQLDTLYRKIIACIRVSPCARALVKHCTTPLYLLGTRPGVDEYDTDVWGEDGKSRWFRFWWRERNWQKIDASINALRGAIHDTNRNPTESAEIANVLSLIDPFHERAAVLRKEIVEHNLRIAVHVAKSHRGSQFNFEDIIQEGNIGLLHAVDKFMVKRGHKFITYATWWIRSHISRYIYQHAGIVALPTHAGERLIKMRKAHDCFQQKHERNPSSEELAVVLNWDIDWVNNLLFIGGRDVSLSQPINSENGTALIDLFKTKIQDEPNQPIIDHQRNKLVTTVLGCLPPRIATVIDLRFGLTRQESSSLKEVGETLASIYQSSRLSRERIRQLEREGLQRIKNDPRAMSALMELR